MRNISNDKQTFDNKGRQAHGKQRTKMTDIKQRKERRGKDESKK